MTATFARAGRSVVGLDLSLRAAAACALPLGWNYDLGAVRMLKTGAKLGADATPRERADRIAQIARDVVVMCEGVEAVLVGVEEYAFNAGNAHGLRLAELGGVVKHEVLHRMGIAVEPVQSGTARKLLLQKLPRSDVKKFVVHNVKRLGGPAVGWTDDECDAFVIANAMLERAGGVAMSFPGDPAIAVERPKKGARKAIAEGGTT